MDSARPISALDDGTFGGREKGLRELTDRLPCAVFLSHFARWDATPVYRFVSAGCKQVLGVDADAIMRDPAMRFSTVHADDLEALEAGIRAVARYGTAWIDEFRVRIDDEVRWVEGRARFERLAGGALNANGYWTDVTARKLLELNRRESHARFRKIFEAGPQPMAMSDANGTIVAVNPAYTRLFGYGLDEVPTLSVCFDKVFPDPGYRAHVERDWKESLAQYERTGIPGQPIVVRIQTKDGLQRIAEVSSSAVLGDVIVAFNDITEQVRVERALRLTVAERDTLLEHLHRQSERLPVALVVSDANDRLTIRDWNPAAERMFGYGRAEVLGRSPYDLFVPPDGDALVREALRWPADSDDTVRVVNEIDTKEGRRIWCEWLNTPLRDESGNVVQVMAMVQDITLRIDAANRMRLWSRVLEQSAEGIFVCDPHERILLVNTAFQRLTGYSAEEAIGKTPRLLQSGRQGPAFYADLWKSLLDTGKWRGEIWNRRKNGELFVEWLSISAVYDEQRVITNFVGIFSDITDRKQAEARIVHLAQYDALTDLPNRVLLLDRLDQVLKGAQRNQSKAAVVFIDLDRFKEVNDSLGHDAGDSLLQIVARRLTETVRAEDTVARLGGDEFVVVLQHIQEAQDSAMVAQKLLHALAQPLSLQGHDLIVTASMGISVFPNDAGSTLDLMRNADAAMYKAKSSGRNTYQFYTSDMNRRALEALSLETGLRRALERGELVLHYQPQVDIATGALVGAEALIRWMHPELGLLMPGRFIAIAEERGLIVAIGRWVMQEAASQIARWQKASGPDLTIAVNLSAVQFHQQGFADSVRSIVRDSGIAPELLELELTESIVMRDAESTIELLTALHAMGLRMSIDDFGTGYSSLNYLRRFPIDRIKIDQSFVRELTDTAETVRIVSGIISLAKGLGLKVIAEGVETAEQLAILRRQQCDEAQGYFYSRALPADAFETLVRQWSPTVSRAPG